MLSGNEHSLKKALKLMLPGTDGSFVTNRTCFHSSNQITLQSYFDIELCCKKVQFIARS